MADFDKLAAQHGGTTAAKQDDLDALAMQLGGQGVMPVVLPDSIPQRVVRDYGQVALRGAAPYATSALTGAAIGGMVGGLPGAAAGAAYGPLALTAADIATSVAGGRTPSTAIKQAVTEAGLGPRDMTREQAVLEAVTEGALGGRGLASGFAKIAGLAPMGRVKNFLTAMGKRPDIQTMAGAGGAGAPVAAQQYFDVNDPYALTGISLGGSALGGFLGGRRVPPAPSVAERKAAAGKAYTAAEQAKVVYSAPSYDTLVADIGTKLKQEGYDPDLQTSIATIMRKLTDKKGADISAEELENARRIAKTAGASSDASTRRLSGIITKEIDNFTTAGPAGRAVSGNLADSVENLLKARDEYTMAMRGQEVERLLARAQRRGDTADAIQAQFRTLADSEKRMRQFTPDQQQMIRQIANGTLSLSVLNTIGKLSPFSQTGLPINVGAAMYEMFGKDVGYIPQNTLAIAGISAGSQMLANRLAKLRAQRLGAYARGAEQLPVFPYGQIAAPAAVNMMETTQRINELTQR